MNSVCFSCKWFAGVAFWLLAMLAAGLIWAKYSGPDSQRSNNPWQAAMAFLAPNANQIEFKADSKCYLSLGDPVFLRVDNGEVQSMKQVGEVRRLRQVGTVNMFSRSRGTARSGWVSDGVFEVYSPLPAPANKIHAVYQEYPRSLHGVISTLLPAARRAKVAQLLAVEFQAHRAQMLAHFAPIIERSLADAWAAAEPALSAAIARRRPQWEAAAERHRNTLVKRELKPLLKPVVWPIVEKEARPAATRIGKELWSRVSLWRLGVGFASDRTPFTGKDHMKKEWDRYMKVEAVPILEKNSEEIVRVQQNILAALFRNQKIRDAASRSLQQFMQDPAVRQLIWATANEAFLQNPAVKTALMKHWTSPAAVKALTATTQEFEPVVERIGELLVGDEINGFTPEFNHVLRTYALHKDRRWVVLEVSEEEATGRSAADPIPLILNAPVNGNPFVEYSTTGSAE